MHLGWSWLGLLAAPAYTSGCTSYSARSILSHVAGLACVYFGVASEYKWWSIHFTLPKQCGAGEVDLHDGRLKSGFSWNITSLPIRYALSIEAMAFVNQSKRDGQPLSPRRRCASPSWVLIIPIGVLGGVLGIRCICTAFMIGVTHLGLAAGAALR